MYGQGHQRSQHHPILLHVDSQIAHRMNRMFGVADQTRSLSAYRSFHAVLSMAYPFGGPERVAQGELRWLEYPDHGLRWHRSIPQ